MVIRFRFHFQVVNTSVPFIFSHALDSLNTANQLSLSTPESAATTMITTTLIGQRLKCMFATCERYGD